MAKDAEGDPAQGKSLEEIALAEQATAEAAQKAADEKAAEDEAADAADDGAADDDAADGKAKGETDDPLMLAKWVDEVTGLKESKNYKNDHEWARGIGEAIKMVGRKNQQAQVGQKALSAFEGREDELLRVLDAAKAVGDSGTDGKGDDGLYAPIDFQYAWVTTDDKGNVVAAPGAPSDAMERYAKIQQRNRDIVADPVNFFRKAMADDLTRLEDGQTKTKEELRQQQKQAEIETLCLKHKALLWVDGEPESGLTPEGEKIDAMVVDDDWRPDISGQYSRIKTAIDLAKAGKPVDRSRKPLKRALRKPDVATAAKQTKSLDERLKAKGLAAVLEEDHKAASAAAG